MLANGQQIFNLIMQPLNRAEDQSAEEPVREKPAAD